VSPSTTQGGGGRILAAASRHRKELSSPRRSRQRGYRALFYAPGLVGLQAGAVVLSPGGHLDSAVSFSAAAVGVLRLEKKNGPLVVSLSPEQRSLTPASACFCGCCYLTMIGRCDRRRG